MRGSVFINEALVCIILAESILWLPCSLPAGFDHESCRPGAKISQLFNSGGCISIFLKTLQVLPDKRQKSLPMSLTNNCAWQAPS